MHRHLQKSLLCLVALAALSTSCAEQQPPINKVEARVYSKTLFTGEWFFGQTVVDVPGSRTVTMVGNTNYAGMYRIRWDIQENFLYARKSYEIVEGGKHINPDTGEFLGTIVGAWKIEKHFDIRRSYNPTTGEENNVLEENDSDCKWYNCKYMRVDWSENHAVDYMFIYDGEPDFDTGGHHNQGKSISYEEWDSSDPLFRPIFDEKNGYIDFTTAMVYDPSSVTIWGWNIPYCWFFENAECQPEILKVRYSFLKRDPNRDYEPRLHQGTKDEWFGYFVQEKLQWDQHYDLVYKTQQKVINRHNIWEKHHNENAPCLADSDCEEAGSKCDKLIKFHKVDVATDSDADGLPDVFESEAGRNLDPYNTDTDGDGTTDKLDDANGNGIRDANDFWKWDDENMEYRCTIPMNQRDPIPVPYYNSGFFPKSMVCDEYAHQPELDNEPGPCEPWQWAPKNEQENNWSVLHKISNDYDETFWKVFLMGGYGLTYEQYASWITSHDITTMDDATREILYKFGDEERGFYAFTICPNHPVIATDPWPCRFPHMSFRQAKELMDQGHTFGMFDEKGNEIAPYARRGDVRFSMVNYVKDYYDGMALLGLGPSMTDPRTGENLAGIANIYALNDWAATNTQEMVQLLNGKMAPDQFINGVALDNWLKKVKAGQNADFAQQQALSQPQVNQMYQSMVQDWMKLIPRLGTADKLALMRDSKGNPLGNTQLKRKLFNATYDSGVLDPSRSPVPDLEILAGTPLEKSMINEEILMAAGINPETIKNSGISEDILDKASLARNGFLKQLEAKERFRYELSNKMNMDFASMTDDAMVGLAYRLKDLDEQQVWTKAREIIMRAVVTHEMGHTVGLHHNWSGSEDVINFFDDYWKLRTNGGQDKDLCRVGGDGQATGLCPFYLKPMTPYQLGTDQRNLQEGTRSLYEYSYSSIMDYAGRYTIDGNGLGKYDKAAIMYGYADKVEVFENTGAVPVGDIAENSIKPNMFDEWYSSYGSPLFYYGGSYNSYHYTNFYAEMGDKVFDERNRKLVPYQDVQEMCYELTDSYDPVPPAKLCDQIPANKKKRAIGWYDKTSNKPRVPYLFCTYTRGDISDGCNTRDYGADQYERMKQLIDGWDTWYPLRAFPRSQFGVDDSSYRGRQYRRLYYRLKNFNDGYSMMHTTMLQWFDPSAVEQFYTSPIYGYGPYTVAMNAAFNMAMRTLAMPDVKQFEFQEKPDGQKLYNEAEYYLHFETDISNARYFATSYYDADYKNECGLKWWECLHHVGFYIDKIMAMMALTSPEANFVGRDTAEDIRKYRISFFNNFTDQIIDFFGGILAEDYDAIAPWFDPEKANQGTVVDGQGVVWNNGIAMRNYATPELDPPKPTSSKAGAVEAATRFTLQIYAAVIGMMRLNMNFNNDFAERLFLWKKGSGIGWDVQPTAKVAGLAHFTDPFTGVTYSGVDYLDDRGIAERMIAHANKLKSRTTYCSQESDAPDKCSSVSMAQRERAESALVQYRQLMDIVVQLSVYYNDWAGQNWSWNPYDP